MDNPYHQTMVSNTTALPWKIASHWDDLPAAGWQIATVRTCQDIEAAEAMARSMEKPTV